MNRVANGAASHASLWPALVIALGALAVPVSASALTSSEAAAVRAGLAGVRLPFIANEGQVDAQVAYYAPTFAGTLFVTRQGQLVYALHGPQMHAKGERSPRSSRPGWSLTEILLGGSARPVAQDRSASGVSTFLGGDRTRWRSGLSTWEQVSLGEVWPGITVALRARGRSIEKVFTVHPGTTVARIRVRVAGAHSLTVDAGGALVASTGLGDVTFTAPVAYQERDGVRRPVAVTYRHQGLEYGFDVGAYDPGLLLVIDPLLQATYLGGGSGDSATALAIHPTTGDVYVAGSTSSNPFPGTVGGAQPLFGGGSDAFIARLPSTLTTLTQATYLGGGDVDSASAIAIHPTTGDVYVAGVTQSNSFPGTAGGAQPAFGGGIDDAFIARLPSTLTTLTQATYLGGGGSDFASALAIHPMTGDVYVAGGTDSNPFPGTAGGAQPAFGGGSDDAFIARLPSTLTTLTQATYLGGGGFDRASALAIHPTTGDVYVAGLTQSNPFPGTSGGAQPALGGVQDAFIARLPAPLTTLTQATYLGGGGGDDARALAIHPTTGDVYVAGFTDSNPFPGTAGGAQPTFGGGFDDAFIARLPGTLTTLTQATYLGGGGDDFASALAIHPTTGDVYVAGSTTFSSSNPFPGTAGGAQPTFGGGFGDAFIARLPGTLTTLTQATYLGGGGDDSANALAIHPTTGDVYVAGGTGFTPTNPFPGTAGGAQPTFGGGGADAFVARLTLDLAAPPDLTITKTHSGGFAQGSAGNTYTVIVTNSAAGSKSAGQTVTVTDTPPSGLTITAMSGTGWTCTTLPTCTRSDLLAASASYPPITLTVSVAANATSPQVNSVSVSTTQAESNTGNNTATDSTTITAAAPPDLTISKTHSGSFAPGSTGNTYTVIVTNSGAGPKYAGQTVTVTDTPPSGLTITAMSGPGWTCTLATLTCTRSDVLAVGSSYPPITLTVSVAANATSLQVNSVSISTTQAESNTSNNTATDSTAAQVNTTTSVTSTNGGAGNAATTSVNVLAPDLTIAKTHAGTFTKGGTGSYTITVSNVGAGPTSGTVTVTDTLPTGLTATAMSGTGWTCSVGTLTCTRSDVLAAGASYPPITLTVSIAVSAPSSVSNTATVSGGGDTTSANDSATDATNLGAAPPDLTIAKTHAGTFIKGQTGDYTITVSNVGAGPTSGTVTVTDTLPTGLTATAMSGTGWTCSVGTLTCTRGDVLAAGASYPPITLTVSIAVTAPSSVSNTATVSGGGDTTPTNDSATDATSFGAAPPDLTIAKTHAGTFIKGQTGDYTITVSNVGAGPTSGTVTVTDTPPTGLTATAMSGTGWTCTLATLTCTRSDALAAGASYSPITLTVSISTTAPNSLTNAATVSGGGDATLANNTATDTITLGAAPIPTLSTVAQAVFVLMIVVTGLMMLHRWRAIR